MNQKEDIDKDQEPPEERRGIGDYMPLEDLEEAEQAIDDRVARRVRDRDT